jgi:hypothetical protein
MGRNATMTINWKHYTADCEDGDFFDFTYAPDNYFVIVQDQPSMWTLRMEWNQGTEHEVLAMFSDKLPFSDTIHCCNLLVSTWLLNESDRLKTLSDDILNAEIKKDDDDA